MKKTNLFQAGLMFAGLLAAPGLTHAATFDTGSINLMNVNGNGPQGANFDGTPYNGTIYYSQLMSGGTQFAANDTPTAGTLTMQVYDAYGFYIYLDFGSFTVNDAALGSVGYTDTHSTEQAVKDNQSNSVNGGVATITFTLDQAELNYIDANNPIYFESEADCHLESYDLNLTATVPQVQTAPDGASTLALLGGMIPAFALLKRKMAPVRA